MGHPAKKPSLRATYADVVAAPPHQVAELIQGTLHLFPRPSPRHANVEGGVLDELRGPFQRGRGGPGGWWILPEPEIHFPDPDEPGEVEIVVPDVAGWRRERLPDLPEEAHFALAPDWICEILSPSTTKFDREEKLPLYGREGVGHGWIVDPIARSLEVFVLGAGGSMELLATHRGVGRVRVPPFEAVELELDGLWVR